MRDVGSSADATSGVDGTVAAPGSARPTTSTDIEGIPDYLDEVYRWAYLNPRNAVILDREVVVSAILWGQQQRLQRAAFAEIEPGSKVFLPANVYGKFVPNLARHVGREGSLDVSDISPTQVAICKMTAEDFPWVSVGRGDARRPRAGQYDAVCCYFLLHELPDTYKCAVVDALLESVKPGGKVVFVDYHKPKWTNPARPIISVIFATLEPFARSIWRHMIEEYATNADDFLWRKETYFGDLYQRVVATRR